MTKVQEVSSLTMVQKYSLWSVFFSLCVAAFIYVASQKIGSVPEVTGFTFFETYTYTFQTPISQWWNVLIPLIWGPMFGIIFANKKVGQKYSHVIVLGEYRIFWYWFSMLSFFISFALPAILADKVVINASMLMSLITIFSILFFIANITLIPILFRIYDYSEPTYRDLTMSALIVSLNGTLGLAIKVGIIYGLVALCCVAFTILIFTLVKMLLFSKKNQELNDLNNTEVTNG
mgnify:CR=1 FL=1